MKITDSLGLNKNITSSQNDDIHNQCSSPIGSMDSIVVVESENGDRHDFTTLQVCETNLNFQNVTKYQLAVSKYIAVLTFVSKISSSSNIILHYTPTLYIHILSPMCVLYKYISPC